MRCFVTGASGQIGSGLVRRLADDGYAVTALVLPGDSWASAAFDGVPVARITGDVTDASTFPDAQFDWIFHLAADQSFWRGDEAKQRAVNVLGVRHLVNWAADTGASRVVHVSSLAAVGLADRPDDVMDEDAVVQPASARLMYAEHKRDGERLALEAADRGLPLTIASPGTVLGPWDHGRHAEQLLGPLIRGAVRFAPGGGVNIVDVRDVADGLVRLARRGVRGRRYLLTGHNLTYAELSDVGAAVLGSRAPRVQLPAGGLRVLAALLERPGLWLRWKPPATPDEVAVGSRYLYFSNARAVAELGFRVRPVRETLSDAVAWYREAGVWP
ncbi:MAG: NAD-dependent epimerase/dehydratase family protein [Chloroflexi bacterium]|nr:NAD-dependent epimerase/dehydratase family protein [Chloroflexota bacterium]